MWRRSCNRSARSSPSWASVWISPSVWWPRTAGASASRRRDDADTETPARPGAYAEVMVQTPLPPTPPPGIDPNFLINQLVPLVEGIAALVAGVLVLRWLFHSPIGEALAEGIRARRRRRWGGGGGDPTGAVGVAAVRGVGVLEVRVGSLQGAV